MESKPDFRVELEPLARGVTLVQTTGEMDFYTAPAFRASVTRALDDGASRVIVDLSELAFIDSSGIGVLVGAVRRATQSAVDLMIVCPPGNVARVFSITGLERMLAFYQTRDEASPRPDGRTRRRSPLNARLLLSWAKRAYSKGKTKNFAQASS